MKMELFYQSTRSKSKPVKASQAILKGLAEDGGLYVPESIPTLDKSLEEFSHMTYQETAYEVMKLFLTDFTEDELKDCINKAYDSKFDTEVMTPLVEADGAYYLELFHGATIAFKDMALSILPHLLITSARKNNVSNEIVILTATSGDTGKAALVGITGNFDDAQTGVKKLFGDKALEKQMADAGFQFSSANSINIGRLVPQVVYYVYAYAQLLKEGRLENGEKINVVVPTGNFGNILAAYFAKHMGVPIAKLICASNENKVQYDFFETGIYDKNREFILTSSPSMDILISSNLERLIYMAAGCDADKNAAFMNSLSKQGKYEITRDMKNAMTDFCGGYATEQETAETIKTLYEKTGYVIDTHTAVAATVLNKYKAATGDNAKTVVASTASPFKFTRSVMNAIDKKYDSMGDFELADELSKLANVKVPRAIEEIRTAPVLHNTVCDKEDMKAVVMKFLGI